MNLWHSFYLIVVVFIALVTGAAVSNDGDPNAQGLYSQSDHVIILTRDNFDRRVYNQNHALLVQFYNSYCGHCRAFAPKFQSLANDVKNWRKFLRLAVMDCSVEENNEICRQFEVMAYPSLRYLHEHYVKGNTNVGDKVQITETIEKFKEQLILKVQTEQSRGRMRLAPPLNSVGFASYSAALNDGPSDTKYTFLVFENDNSTIGSELALNLNDYQYVRVKRVHDTSELAHTAGINKFPGIVVVKPNLEATILVPKETSFNGLLDAINLYLKSQNYVFPIRDLIFEEAFINAHSEKPLITNTDIVYYSDLEKTLKTSLHTEITRYKYLDGEPLRALLDYLAVLINSFPARGNLKEYLMSLRASLTTKSSWTGSEIYDHVRRLENEHAPVYITNLEYVGCKGSQPKYRGYSCGLWTLFHTLTVNAAAQSSSAGPKVLNAMYGYIKHFFGCTECAEHFQVLAARNKIFDVKDHDKAVLWLWISHNEVNLRLAGDVTEDPQHPKYQFPSVSQCPSCRLSRGAWNLPAVFVYLQTIYGGNNIQEARTVQSASGAPSPFSSMDIGMLSLLYILSFIILILVIRYFLTKRFYRKRPYKHGRGKV